MSEKKDVQACTPDVGRWPTAKENFADFADKLWWFSPLWTFKKMKEEACSKANQEYQAKQKKQNERGY